MAGRGEVVVSCSVGSGTGTAVDSSVCEVGDTAGVLAGGGGACSVIDVALVEVTAPGVAAGCVPVMVCVTPLISTERVMGMTTTGGAGSAAGVVFTSSAVSVGCGTFVFGCVTNSEVWGWATGVEVAR